MYASIIGKEGFSSSAGRPGQAGSKGALSVGRSVYGAAHRPDRHENCDGRSDSIP